MLKDVMATLEREKREADEIRSTVVELSRHSLVQALNVAADVMQNSCSVAVSQGWQEHYHQLMTDWRSAANLISRGAKIAIKKE